MAGKDSVIPLDAFEEGALRQIRQDKGSQRYVANGAGFCAGTLSRAERGLNVNFTSAILIGYALGILDERRSYKVNADKVQTLLRYMKVVQRGGHAKGWNDYYAGVGELLKKAA